MKKLISLLLTLTMALALAACGAKAPAIPDPAATVEAYLAYALHDDAAPIQTLYGYATPDQAIAEQADDLNIRQALLDGLNGEELNADAQTLGALADSLLALLGRIPYSCTTVSRDDEAGTALVTVTVNTLPETSMTDGLTAYATPILMQNLDKLTDEKALYTLTLEIMADYIDQLQPTDQTATVDVALTLTETTVNGKTRPAWDTDETGGESMGEDVMSAIFGQEFFQP